MQNKSHIPSIPHAIRSTSDVANEDKQMGSIKGMQSQSKKRSQAQANQAANAFATRPQYNIPNYVNSKKKPYPQRNKSSVLKLNNLEQLNDNELLLPEIIEHG